MNSPPSRHSLKTRITLATLGVFLASLWTLSLFSTRGLQRDIEKLVSADQLVTAGLIAEQLDHELKERLQSLQALEKQLRALQSRCAANGHGQHVSGECPVLHELLVAARGEGCVCHGQAACPPSTADQADLASARHAKHHTRPAA